MELGMGEEAWNTLEELPPEAKLLPQVYVLQLKILVLGQHWEKAEILGDSLVARWPDNGEIWLCLAKARVGLGKLDLAKQAAVQVSIFAPELRLTMLEEKQLAPLWGN